jgi:tetratricopeptide (TPR) repeat protein
VSAAADLNRASAMIDMARFDHAARLLTALVASAPDNSRAWCLLARAQLGAGRADQALEAARRAGQLDPADDWPHRLASTALISMGKPVEAMSAALQARNIAPHFWRSHVCLAQAAAEAGQHQLAAGAAAEAVAIAPGEPDVHFTMGKVALAAGDLASATASQQAALAIDPGHAGAINELGRISLRARDASGAAGYFLRAARSAPGAGVFGRNTEVALARVAAAITVPASLVIAAAVYLPVLDRAWSGWLDLLLLVAALMVAGYAVQLVRKLPADGRRHLVRMLRRRQAALAVAVMAAAVMVITGAGVLAVHPLHGYTGLELPARTLLAGVMLRLMVSALARRRARPRNAADRQDVTAARSGAS